METTIIEDKSIQGGEEIQADAQAAEAQAQAEATPADKKQENKVANAFKQFFTARRIAYIATFTALSFALRFLSFTILPAVPYLKFDFSDAIVLICAYAMGPTAGLITGILKEVLYGAFFSGSAFVGELANIIVMIPFILIPSIIYKKHKGIKSVVIWIVVACLVRTLWSFPVNWLLNFPAFMGFNWKLGMDMFMKVWYWAMLFNLIKNVILAATVMLLYKSVSRFINLINRKFDERKAKKTSSQAQG